MESWILNFMDSLGYPGLIFLMFLENVFPPIPSELVMPAAGYAAARSGRSLLGVIVAGSIGSLLGQLPLYWIGSKFGLNRARRLAETYGHWVLVSSDDIDRSVDWLSRYGKVAVLVCRVIPGLRSLISIPAGITHMPLVSFLGLTSIGTIIWTAMLAWLGSQLGTHYEQVSTYLGPVSSVVTVVVVGGFLLLIGRRYFNSFRKRASRRSA